MTKGFCHALTVAESRIDAWKDVLFVPRVAWEEAMIGGEDR